jgi:hypothetical protein
VILIQYTKHGMNNEKIWKIQKKSKLNSEKIGKIWKKGKLKKSDMSVTVIYHAMCLTVLYQYHYEE